MWCGQPPEIQFTRGGGVAEPKIFGIFFPNQCTLVVHGVLGAKRGTVNTVVTVPYPTPHLFPPSSLSGGVGSNPTAATIVTRILSALKAHTCC